VLCCEAGELDVEMRILCVKSSNFMHFDGALVGFHSVTHDGTVDSWILVLRQTVLRGILIGIRLRYIICIAFCGLPELWNMIDGIYLASVPQQRLASGTRGHWVTDVRADNWFPSLAGLNLGKSATKSMKESLW